MTTGEPEGIGATPEQTGAKSGPWWLWATLVAGIVLLVAINSGGGDDDPDRGMKPLITQPSTVVVHFEVEGTGPYADITYTTPTGIEQATPDLPMSMTDGRRGLRISFPRGKFVSLSAQMNEELGEITCRISVNGTVISENTSTSSYGIASCQGQAG